MEWRCLAGWQRSLMGDCFSTRRCPRRMLEHHMDPLLGRYILLFVRGEPQKYLCALTNMSQVPSRTTKGSYEEQLTPNTQAQDLIRRCDRMVRNSLGTVISRMDRESFCCLEKILLQYLRRKTSQCVIWRRLTPVHSWWPTTSDICHQATTLARRPRGSRHSHSLPRCQCYSWTYKSRSLRHTCWWSL